MLTPNLVRLFTIDGAVYVDTLRLATAKHCVTVYTRRGLKLADVGRTVRIRQNAQFGVHVNNLFATKELAQIDYDKVTAAFFGGRSATC